MAVGPKGPAPLRLLQAPDLLQMVSALMAPGPSLAGVISQAGQSDEALQRLFGHLARGRTQRRLLHPLLHPSAEVAEFEVHCYEEKNQVVSHVVALAAQHGLSTRGCLRLEQALDELLLNALYDAPVDEQGRPRYLHASLAERMAYIASPPHGAKVRCAGDSRRFVVAVRDPFGTLRRETALAYLHRCAFAQAEKRSPIEIRPGGAGVGLYLVASCATELLFRLDPNDGRAEKLTEVVCALEMAPSPAPLRALLFL